MTSIKRATDERSLVPVLTQMTDEYFQRARFSMSAQVAGLLLELGEDRYGEIVVPYTHEQLAKLLNTYLETVSALVSQFRRDDLILTGRGQIRLLDISALTEIAIG